MSKFSATIPTVLVVDADAAFASTLCDALVIGGLSTLWATTGQAAIQLAIQRLPQLIICDIELPDISGYEVLEKLRSHKLMIPVIMLAAKDVFDTFRRSMEYGADDYLTKPISSDALLRAVQTQLVKREQLVRHLTNTVVSIPKESIENDNLKAIKTRCEDLKQVAWSKIWTIQLESYWVIQASYGHTFGQSVLQFIQQRLQQWQDQQLNRTISIETLTDLEKNRFIVLLSAAKQISAKQYNTVMQELKAALQYPLVINNHQLIPDISIQSVCVSHQKNVDTLIQNLTYNTSAINQFSSAEKLRRAIQTDQLQLCFQPQVDLSSGQIIGAEALVRWIIPGKPPKLPGEFLPIAEENDLMLPLGDWVLERAFQQLAHWQKIELSGLTMAINLSIYQLNSTNFLQRLIAAVNLSGVNPVMMDLELPESLIMADLGHILKLLTELQGLGFSIALDDFGSGLSTLSYLQHLPVNILKIDKCFVRDLHQNRANQIVVKAILEMAHGLSLLTTASGVETARELSILKQLNCRTMQGYLFSPALAAADFETLFLRQKSRRLAAVGYTQ